MHPHMLEHYSQGRLKDLVKTSDLAAQQYTNDQQVQLQNFINDYESIIRPPRNNIDVFQKQLKESGNADLATGLITKQERWSWFTRSYLK